jgi:hypothetical protein
MTEQDRIRMQYAGAIGLLCELSTRITDPDDQDMLDAAVQDWCEISGWTWQRILDRVELLPPRPDAPRAASPSADSPTNDACRQALVGRLRGARNSMQDAAPALRWAIQPRLTKSKKTAVECAVQDLQRQVEMIEAEFQRQGIPCTR